MLTKDECEKALDSLYKVADKLVLNHDIFIGSYNALKNLIQEHFSNPPLTFEELKEDMWVWDKKFNQWIQIDETWSSYKKFINVWIVGSDLLQTIEFEPDRFYRKEVPGMIKLCPLLITKEEVKAVLVGTGDYMVQNMRPCLKEKCVAYCDNRCSKFENSVEIDDSEVQE